MGNVRHGVFKKRVTERINAWYELIYSCVKFSITLNKLTVSLSRMFHCLMANIPRETSVTQIEKMMRSNEDMIFDNFVIEPTRCTKLRYWSTKSRRRQTWNKLIRITEYFDALRWSQKYFHGVFCSHVSLFRVAVYLIQSMVLYIIKRRGERILIKVSLRWRFINKDGRSVMDVATYVASFMTTCSPVGFSATKSCALFDSLIILFTMGLFGHVGRMVYFNIVRMCNLTIWPRDMSNK